MMMMINQMENKNGDFKPFCCWCVMLRNFLGQDETTVFWCTAWPDLNNRLVYVCSLQRSVLWWHGRPCVRVQFLELTNVFCAFIVGDRLPRDGVCLRSFIGRCGSCSVQSVRSRQIGIMRMRSEKSTRRRSFVNSRRLALERLFAQYGFWLQILSFPTRLSPKRPRHSFAHSSAQQSRRPFRKLMFIYYLFIYCLGLAIFFYILGAPKFRVTFVHFQWVLLRL